MDTFKGQNNAEIKELCSKTECELVIVPHNLTNRFQPLHITTNHKTKKFISHKLNTWYRNFSPINATHGTEVYLP